MLPLPAASHDAEPAPRASTETAASAEASRGFRGRESAALATAAGLGALAVLAAAWMAPRFAIGLAPLAVLLAAAALWSAARGIEQNLRGEIGRLSARNRNLARQLEALSDAAWERQDSEQYQGLVDARERAEAASRAKSRVLATVSHEFRTPLNGILGLTELLLEGQLTPDQETYARGVKSSGEALLALVDDMLDFTKIEAGRLDLHPEPTEVEALLQEISELLAARAYAKGIDIAVDVARQVPRRILVDPSRLRQVLLNLAGNGVKFTEAGGVTLSASMSEEAGPPRIVFAVADSGPGVAPEEAERIFGEFEQIDSALARRHGGTGLGLAISRRIVRGMGGDIALKPGAGGGAVFSFALDLIGAEPSPAISPVLRERRILILAPAGAEPPALAGMLVEAGAAARLTGTPVEAAGLAGAAAAAALPYEAVLIDQRVLADAAVLPRLREAAGSRIPAVVLIEPARRGEIERMRASGFDAYLVRPVRRSSLLRIVDEVIAGTGGFRVDPGDARPPRAGVPGRAAASLEVLLAEDNPINALLVRAVLERLGHTVTEVRDGAAAVAAATAGGSRFAAILLDLHMPGLDGLAAAREIRACERRRGTARAAILALTADVLAETRSAAVDAGIDAVLEKPVGPEALRRALLALTAA